MTDIFSITTILDSGSWTGTKPVLAELVPQARDKNGDRGRAEVLIDLKQLAAFARVVIIDKGGEIRNALGMAKGLEAVGSEDIYDFIIHALTYSDAKNIFNDIRAILTAYIAAQASGTYRDFQFPEAGITPALMVGECTYTFSIIASIGGYAVEEPS